MPKKWIVATAALAVVKGKKITKKREKANKKAKQPSSCSVSSDECSSSGEEHPSSDGTDSKRSSVGSGASISSFEDQLSEGSDTTDSSSSYGCGTYHRRESLSESSSSFSSDDSSLLSRSRCGSSRSSESCSSSNADDRSPSSVVDLRREPESDYQKSHAKEEALCDRDSESFPVGVAPRPSLKSLVKAMSSKNLKRDADPDVDEESEVSSNISCKSNKISTNTKPCVSLTPSMYDDEQASLMRRRRSSVAGRGRGRVRVGAGRSCSTQQVKGDGFGDCHEKKVKAQPNVEDKFSDLLQTVRSQKLSHEVVLEGERRRDEAEDKFNALLERVRSQNPTSDGESSMAEITSRVPAAGAGTVVVESNSDGAVETLKTTESREVGGELSYSLKTELLANANSNLRSSVTSMASEDSLDSQNDDASKKSVGSSRFASMMANLKSANEATSNNTESNANYTFSRGDDGGSDDEHIFEAPKIVNERGQSMRSLSSNEVSSASVHSDDSIGEKKSDHVEEEESTRSRFRVRRPSLRQLIRGKSDKPLELAHNKHVDGDGPEHVSSQESLDEYHSDDGSKQSDASISTASSGEDQNSSSVTNLARMRYPEDEENSSDDDVEYYGEPAMTILTPITEMGSMESDAETTSNVSDASETDSDDDVAHHQWKADMANDQGKHSKLSHESPGYLFQTIKRVRANDPDLKYITLDDSGLNDFDAAKLLYLLHDNSHVTHVSLANNKLGDGSAVSLAQVLIGSATIKHVCLRGNNIGNKGALALTKVLRVNKALIHLDLNDNDIDTYVLEGLQKSSLVVVPHDPSMSCQREESDEIQFEETDRYVSRHEPTETCAQQNESQYYFGDNKRTVVEDIDVSRICPSLEVEAKCQSQSVGASTPEALCFALTNVDRKESLDDYSVTCVYDEICVCDQVEGCCAFPDKVSSPGDPESQGLLPVSLALSGLDAGWLLKANSGGAELQSYSNYYFLGDRERIPAWKKWVGTEELISIGEGYGPDELGSYKRKASRSLQKMTSSRWKQSLSKASSLRKSLLNLSEQNIKKELAVTLDSPQSLRCTRVSSIHPSSSSSPCLESLQHWATSFKKLDPRWQIRKFFNDMSVFGTVLSDVTCSDHLSEGAAIFSVWRPTSADAISKMMRGDGVGKGLEIKGKSAKNGDLSGFIPFLQIHDEEHKKQIRTIPKGDRTKIFFKNHDMRDRVGEYLGMISKELTLRVAQAKFALARAKFGCDPNVILREELNYAAKTLSYELENPKVVQNDDYAPEMYCIEVSCRVLWEGLVERKDISRTPGSRFHTGRASQPAFQDMNFAALRQRNSHEPLPVLYQYSEEDPFDARMIVMAYEEEGKVVPVVSDFDCFLIGSRNFSYEDPMSSEQVELLDWCVSQIEWILESHTCPESWTSRWLEVLKYAARNGFYPSMPRFGFGDPTSYSMIEASVHRSAKTCGAVRHGPECFNFFFPQELDDEFLIIFPGNQMWKYVKEKELLRILHEKIQEGFTFPLNPKWLLCDPGWISLFRNLLGSHHSSVQNSLDLWFPRESGLRERILNINLRFPDGFRRDDQVRVSPSLAEEEYERYLILQRARRKMRGFIYWRNLLLDVRQRATSCADDNCRGTVNEFQFLCNKSKRLLSGNAVDVEDETMKEIQKLNFFGRNEE